jgi:hypothetical protein
MELIPVGSPCSLCTEERWDSMDVCGLTFDEQGHHQE